MRALALLLLGCSGSVEQSPAPGPECGGWVEEMVLVAPESGWVRLLAAPGHEGAVRFRPQGYDSCEGVTCVRAKDGAEITVLTNSDDAQWQADESADLDSLPACP